MLLARNEKMNSEINKHLSAGKLVRRHRRQSIMQSGMIMAVAVGAAMLVGLTGFSA